MKVVVRTIGNILDSWENILLDYDGYQASRTYPPCFSNMFCKPSAVRIDTVFLHGCCDGTDELLMVMPKISQRESTLLYDLLSKMFVYDPADRITASQMLDHPWFAIDGTLTNENSTDSSLP